MTYEVMDMLNPDLNWDEIRDELQSNGRYVIKNILVEELADRIHNCLMNEIQWQAAFRDGQNDQVADVRQLQAMPPADQQKLMQDIITVARNGYQFYYNRYPVVDNYMKGINPDLFLNRVLEFLNSPLFLDFAHHITLDKQIRKAEAQATCYLGGHFLKFHSDLSQNGDDRRYAYVLGFTKDWVTDWGGLLQFVDGNKVTETFTPGYNTLSIFKVPQDHQVSYVSPYALNPRLTLTGWLRAD